MNISRSNYDKPFRCPVDSGPGFNHAKDPDDCYGTAPDGGPRWEQDVFDRGSRDWSLDKTRCCGTWVLPANLCYLDPEWLWWRMTWRLKIRWRYSALRKKLNPSA